MTALTRQALGGLVFFILAMGLFLFGAAWTIHYWQAWVYLILVGLSTFSITFYLMRTDTALLRRRMNVGATAEKEQGQKVIQFISQFAFIATYVLPALDHRFGWSVVPTSGVIVADVVTVIGFFIVFLVFRENTYTSAIIEIAENQSVTTTGPYAVVRHPMYSGALLALLATPIALGSWWGLLAFLPMLFVIIWRLFEEEKFLTKNLNGYESYTRSVRSRLVPWLF